MPRSFLTLSSEGGLGWRLSANIDHGTGGTSYVNCLPVSAVHDKSVCMWTVKLWLRVRLGLGKFFL